MNAFSPSELRAQIREAMPDADTDKVICIMESHIMQEFRDAMRSLHDEVDDEDITYKILYHLHGPCDDNSVVRAAMNFLAREMQFLDTDFASEIKAKIKEGS